MPENIKYVVIFLLTLLTGCDSTLYYGDDFDGYVIDADTKAPIHGAVVVASVSVYKDLLEGDAVAIGPLHLDESITDSRGYYHFDKWGPVKNKYTTVLSNLFSYIHVENKQPILVIYKEGYKPSVYYSGHKYRHKKNNGVVAVWDRYFQTIPTHKGSFYFTRFSSEESKRLSLYKTSESDFSEKGSLSWLTTSIISYPLLSHLSDDCDKLKIINLYKEFKKVTGWTSGGNFIDDVVEGKGIDKGLCQ